MYDAIDSDYLHKMARNYDGMFGYIPDAIRLGTTVVHGIANIMTTAVHASDLTLTFPEGAEIEHVMVGSLLYEVNKETNSAKIHVGDLRYGQDLDFLVAFEEGTEPTTYTAALTYHQGEREHSVRVKDEGFEECEPEDNWPHLFRFEVINML